MSIPPAASVTTAFPTGRVAKVECLSSVGPSTLDFLAVDMWVPTTLDGVMAQGA